jgi:glucose dehydrogenase
MKPHRGTTVEPQPSIDPGTDTFRASQICRSRFRRLRARLGRWSVSRRRHSRKSTSPIKVEKRIAYALVLSTLFFLAPTTRSSDPKLYEWPTYAGSKTSAKYAPLSQIDAGNVDHLKIVWRWQSPDSSILSKNPGLATWKFEATPIMVGGILYTSTSLSQVAAIDAARGITLWVYDPQSYHGMRPPNFGYVHRGVAYWSDRNDSRIFIGTGDGYLIALDAKSGTPISSFGKNGRIDLTEGLRRPIDRALYGLDSPPIICRDTVIVGSNIPDFLTVKTSPPGDVRGFDVRTGKLRWTFHTIPASADEYGANTWKQDSWREIGGANVWAPMSADDQLGYVYLPVSAPSSDRYGGRRPGDGLFGETLVCIDARTGKRIWHFQFVHHGVWDYDPPAAPIVMDIGRGAHIVRGVVQVSKQGFVYAFDRVSGKPLWPMPERPVPVSHVPGEISSPTQPIPDLPKPFDQQGLSVDDLINLTPKLNAEARAILQSLDDSRLYAPPSLRRFANMPGFRGGASWSGAAYDPESGILYVPSVTLPYWEQLVPQTPSQFPDRYRAFEGVLSGPEGLPITNPPWGRVTAIDMHTGINVWMQPMGNGPRDHPALKPLHLSRLGWPYRGFPLLTRTLLLVAQEGAKSNENDLTPEFVPVEPSIQVFNKHSGELLKEIPIPSNATGQPMTYMLGGKQYIVMAIGGGNIPAELIALALP